MTIPLRVFLPRFFFGNDYTADVYIRNFDASENKRLKLFHLSR